MRRPALSAALLAAALLALPARAAEPWVGAWQAAPAAVAPNPAAPLVPIQGQTLRQRLEPTLGGKSVRVTLTNAYGGRPLVVAGASIGRMVGGKLDPASIRPLAFTGARGVTIPIGAPALSDPVDLPVKAGETLAISLYLPGPALPETFHRALPAQDRAGTAPPEALLSGPGDFTAAADLPGAAPAPRLFVSRLDVLATTRNGAVVVLGTTRTEGEGRWPALLAPRLAKAGRALSVVNASMVANPLTRPYTGGGEAALARFDRDVLMVPGVRYVILVDAINDIGQAGRPEVPLPTLAELQAAYRQMVARAHARDVKAIAATLLPFAGVPFANFYSEEKERLRGQLNDWIRTGGAFDGVIDFDAMLRDPANPLRYAPGLGEANNFGPSLAGDARLAERIDLNLFR
jgi:lysophospholipase L1-like esterase